MTTGWSDCLNPGDLVFHRPWRSRNFTTIYTIVGRKFNPNFFDVKCVYKLRNNKWVAIKTSKGRTLCEYSMSPITPEALTNILVSLEEQAKFIKNLLNSL